MALPKTLEQGRASIAFDLAGAGMKSNPDYKNKVKSFPMMIKTNGLGAAVAFIKGKDAVWKNIYKQIEDYLKTNDLFNEYKSKENGQEKTVCLKQNTLDDYLTKIDSSLYRAITIETLALFTWLRRFAEGLAKD
jgi:CRISPR-associated protein Cmr5